MRACAGCKKRDENEKFIRFVEFEGRPVPDVARRAPGRGFNVCPTYSCIKDFVKRNFRGKVDPEEVFQQTVESLRDYLLHLVSLSHKTGVTVVGQDNIKELPPEKEGVLILSSDLSSKTKERLKKRGNFLVVEDLFSSEELGNALRRETRAGALFVEKVGLGRKLYSVAEKLNSLLTSYSRG